MSAAAGTAKAQAPGAPAAPVLDARSPDDIYAACVAGARAALPTWAVAFGDAPDWFDRSDPGLVMFKLFAELMHKLARGLNGVPDKYRLAFWDFLGAALRPPTAAEAPLAFSTTGKSVVEVPAGTRVIGPTIPGVVFETSEALTVLPVTLAAAFAVRPDADAYTDLSTRIADGPPFSPFGANQGERRFAHALLLDDPGFAVEGLTGSLTVSLEGANLLPRYFDQWRNARGEPLNPERTVSGYDTLAFTFADLPDLPTGIVAGRSGRWLVVAPADDVQITAIRAEVLPQIHSLALTLTYDAVTPDAAFANAAPVDLKRGGRPFGATPARQDAFYLSSRAALSRAQVMVTIAFTLQTVNLAGSVALVWEYWDGAGWAPLPVVDGTAALTRSGTVSFVCPQIEETAVNNVKGYWVRVRIDQGGYGAAAGLVVSHPAAAVVDDVLAPFLTDPAAAVRALAAQGLNFGYTYRPTSYTPPFIEALAIGCQSVTRPATALAHNRSTVAPLGHRPFSPPEETCPTFYLGLASDVWDDAVAGHALTLFFRPQVDPARAGRSRAAVGRLAVDYRARDGWKPLSPIRTDGIAQSDGIVTFAAPADLVPTVMFDRELRWLRAAMPPDAGLGDVTVGGIHTNVVGAINAVRQAEIVIGSGTGAPDQTFPFPQRPILADPIVEIYEPTPVLFSPDDADLLAENAAAIAAAGDAKQVWVRWQEVSNLDFSTPGSRHYLLDHQLGQVTFGDGVRGRAPPPGRRNIRSTYRYGGGTAGNVPAGSLTATQRAITGLASLTNVMPAAGGLGGDTVADLSRRAPADIGGQGRAVTLADFADVAMLASQDVARAVCVPLPGSTLRLAILPHASGAMPMPGFDLSSQVTAFVQARALPPIAARLSVAGPSYRPVAVTSTVRRTAGSAPPAVRQAVATAIATFLHPLHGNADGNGWPFGARLGAAALAVAIGAAPGVAMVEGVTLDGDLDAITFEDDQLPCVGATVVTVADALPA